MNKLEINKFLADLFLHKTFRDTKLKFSVLQSSQRCNSHNYKRRASLKTNDLETSENLPSAKILNEIKLDKELETLIDLFEIGIEELSSSNKWKKLIKAINSRIEEERSTQQTGLEVKKNKQKLKELQTLLETHKQKTLDRLAEQQEKLHSLRHNLRNVHKLNSLEYDLVRKWEANRLMQAKVIAKKSESLLRDRIEHYQELHAAESKRFEAAVKFLKIQMKNYEKTIAYWKHKSAEKFSSLENKLQAQEQKIYELSKLHERQREIYAQRVQYVEEYRAQKAAEEQLLLQEMRRIQSVVQIQAWWRGTMVRRGLGPYRKKSKKSKKSKAK